MESTTNMKSSKDRGIVRIDQPEKYNHGWWVRRRRGTKMYSKFFADKKNGGKNKARLAAREFNEELTNKLPPVSRRRSASKNGRVAATTSASARTTETNRGRNAIRSKAVPASVRPSSNQRKGTHPLFEKAQRLTRSRRRMSVAR